MTRRGLIFTAPSVLAMLAGRKDVTRRLGERAPCAEGDLVWAREAWRVWRDLDHIAPRELVLLHETDNFWIDYLASPFFPDGDWGRTRSPLHLPFALSRPELHRRCVSVRREPLGAVTDEDAIREGVQKLDLDGPRLPGWQLGPGSQSFWTPRDAYISALEALHGRQLPLDTPVWRVELGSAVIYSTVVPLTERSLRLVEGLRESWWRAALFALYLSGGLKIPDAAKRCDGVLFGPCDPHGHHAPMSEATHVGWSLDPASPRIAGELGRLE